MWSSEPWDARGPWGGRGPGGRPWRPAGHVGRNFHQSMVRNVENCTKMKKKKNRNTQFTCELRYGVQLLFFTYLPFFELE